MIYKFLPWVKKERIGVNGLFPLLVREEQWDSLAGGVCGVLGTYKLKCQSQEERMVSASAAP